MAQPVALSENSKLNEASGQQQDSYGAVSDNQKPQPVFEGRLSVHDQQVYDEQVEVIMSDYGSPLMIFVRRWGKVAAVMTPLVFIVVMNNIKVVDPDTGSPIDLFMACDNGNHTLPTQLACMATAPGIRLFPQVAILATLLLMSLMMLNERAFYVLLREKIMIDFDAAHGFKNYVRALVFFMFGLGCSHGVLRLTLGHPCSDQVSCFDRYLLTDTTSAVIHDPKLLLEPQNKEFVYFAGIYAMKFIVPGIICLVALLGMDEWERELISAPKLFEAHPCSTYRILGKFVFVVEGVMHAIMHNGLDVGKNGDVCSMMSVGDEVYQKAKDRGCPVLGDPGALLQRDDVDEDAMSMWKRISEALFISWWPARLLLDLNLVDDESVKFKRLMALHFMLSLLAAIVFTGLMLYHAYDVFFVDVVEHGDSYMLYCVVVYIIAAGVYCVLAKEFGNYAKLLFATDGTDDKLKTSEPTFEEKA